jgi:2-amino-4-hydroxy-6-hydroxymethyldihydropteridine diphosphokinase
MVEKKVYLLLGGNLGDVGQTFQLALEQLTGNGVIKVLKKSNLYRSAPWGFEHENYFLNQVVSAVTELSPSALLDRILETEKHLGRIRNEKGYSARVIDIDILFFNEEVIQLPHLIIPHPLVQERKFALVPLVEVNPKLFHPVFRKTVDQLLQECTDFSKVEPCTGM